MQPGVDKLVPHLGLRMAPVIAESDRASAAHSPTALLIIGAIVLFCACVRASDTTPAQDSIQRLPVIDRQDIRFVPLSVGGERFQRRVNALAQDNYGFVWLGTDDGLYRYDGYTLRTYRHDPGNPGSLSDNTVFVLYKDRAGILWIGTGYGGLDRFDATQDAFTHYQHDPNDNRSLRDGNVFSIYQDLSGSLWIGTSEGLDRLDVASGRFLHYPHPSDNPGSYAIWGLYEDGLGNFLVGCAQGLYKLERSSGRFSLFSNIISNRLQADIEWFAQDRSGALWFTSLSENTVGAINPKTGELRRYVFDWKGPRSTSVRVSRVREDRNGVLWIGTERDGLFKFDQERKSFSRYNTAPDGGNSGQIWDLLEDSEGNMWVGDEFGVSRFQSAPHPFVNYQHEPGDPNSLPDNKVLSVHSDAQGLLWIGTRAGLQRLDRKTGQVVLYQHDPKDPGSLSHNEVSAIQEDGPGGLWIGTHGGGLNRFDRVSGRFLSYRHNPKDPQSLSNDIVMSLFVDPAGVLWVGTQDGGLDRFDAATGHFKIYRNDSRVPHSLSFDIVGAILTDRTGTLWVGTNYGLDRFDRETDSFTVYLHDEHSPASLSSDGINSIYEDHQGTLWIGTRHGLNRFDHTRGTFESLTTQDGLANDYIEGIREDSRGNLWLATHEGLSELRPQTTTVRNYSEADGLPGNFASPTGTGRSCVTPEGELVFGSDHGLTVFNPNRVSANPFVPPVVLTDLLLFNKPVLPSGKSPLHQAILAAHSLTLSHEQSIFTLQFAALSYVAPERNRYRYKLENLEKEWNEVGGERRVATYTSLAPGKYVFRVQGSNDDLVWNETGVRLDITVLPPWWGTWWFRTLVLLSIAGLIFAGYRWRVRSLRLAASRLELQVAQRTRELQIARDAADAANRAKSSFLASMSHELRTPLNAILGFSSLLRDDGVSEKQRRDLDIINRSGEHLLNLINDVLDVAKIESGRMELQIAPCDLKRLVADVTDMMSVRAAEKNLTLDLVESPVFPRVARTDTGKLRQVLINLLGNAVKFTEKGTVTLRSDSRPAGDGQHLLLTFEVDDTGMGIAEQEQSRIFDAFVQAGKQPNQKGTGLGLTISRQFVELMGGTIQVASTLGKGTRFRVELPVEHAEESEVTPSQTEGEPIIGVEVGQPDCRVLIVEDVEENRLVLERLMENTGFQVRLSEDGAQGVEIYRSWRPQFIWMDLGMPVMDGKEATRRIRALDGGREVKIVAVTASAFVSERDEVLAAGVDDFIRKPYQPSEIFDCMARHLGLRRIYDKPRQEEQPGALGKEDLQAIPPDLVRELASVVVTLDAGLIREVIARISDCDEAVARKLTFLADQSAYTPILKAVAACKESHEESKSELM